jgi:hypothetical protein
MSASKLHNAKDDDHLIIFLGQITKGLQGWDCHVCWSCHDGDRREQNNFFETIFTEEREGG